MVRFKVDSEVPWGEVGKHLEFCGAAQLARGIPFCTVFEVYGCADRTLASDSNVQKSSEQVAGLHILIGSYRQLVSN